MEDPLVTEARCPLHPAATSCGVCTRCGNYVCDTCTESGAHGMCPTCRARTTIPFPFTRERWSTRELLNHGYQCFKARWSFWVVATLCMGLMFVIAGAVQGGIQIAMLGARTRAVYPLPVNELAVSSATSLAVNLALTPILIGYIRLCLYGLRGRELKLGTLLEPYAQFVPIASVVVVSSVLGFILNLGASWILPGGNSPTQTLRAVGLFGLPILPIAIYIGLGLTFVYAVLAAEPEIGALESVKRSWRLANGQRVGILTVCIACALLCGVGALCCFLPILMTATIASLAWSGCYLALSTSRI